MDDSDGRPLAVVVTDPGLALHRDVLDPAVAAVRLSLENVRLQAAALARLEEVTQSRRRLVLAGAEERRRVERDLHDGAQQRLLAVAASLSRARERAPDAASLAVLDAARDDLRAALGELRGLAAGLHPAGLSQSGLAAALGSVTDRLPVGVRTEVEDRRWPPAIEMAAYFVICECLTNVVKHSGALTATVRVNQQRDHLMLTVMDDGVGGATPSAGRGLAGLADRVAALGGTLSVDSAPGQGTRVQVALPCV
jgi:signal transduction histidine kinase